MTKKYFFLFLFFFCFSKIFFGQSWQWATNGVQSGVAIGQRVAVDSMKNSYVTGYYRGTFQIGTFTITNNASIAFDIFIAKFDSTGAVVWLKSAGGSGDDKGEDIAIDKSGNVYVVGYYTGPSIFDTIPATGSSKNEFIAKYSNNGNIIWLKTAGASSDQAATGIEIDKEGNCFVTGYFYNTISFGNVNLTSLTCCNIFIYEIDSLAQYRWAVRAGGSYGGMNSKAYDIAIDNDDNCYITGSYLISADFGSYTIPGPNLEDAMFIAKCDSVGTFLWVKYFGGMPLSNTQANACGNSISSDNNGGLFITGQFTDHSFYDSITSPAYISDGGRDIITLKMDYNGNLIWAKQAGGTNNWDVGYGVVADGKGGCYVTGGIGTPSATFGSLSINVIQFNVGFIADYDSTGYVSWVKTAHGTNSSSSMGFDGVAVDRENNRYVTGSYETTSYFDTISMSFSGTDDFVVAKLDSASSVMITNTSHVVSSEQDIQLSPNPSNGKINLIFKNTSVEFLKILDARGSTVFATDNSGSGSLSIDVSGLSEGIYFLLAFGKDGSISTRKFVINKNY